jgi:aldose 1-epimerase
MDLSRFAQTTPEGTAGLIPLIGGGLEAWICTRGATVVALRAPDRRGAMVDVVLGYDDLGGYQGDRHYLGALCGRYANRIAGGRFVLDGREHRLAANNGDNHLHGGLIGFDKRLWQVVARTADGVHLRLDSAAGDEGYPGALTVEAQVRLADGALAIDLEAHTDAPTVVNLTHHGYFNLAGHASGSVLDQVLTMPAESFIATDAASIPLPGGPAAVAGTPFDFRAGKALGKDIGESHEQLQRGSGYDHHFVVPGTGYRRHARLSERSSGRTMELWSDADGVQLYSGNFLALGGLRGKSGAPFAYRGGVCLEPQQRPDSPNRPDFPSTVLRPGQVYRHRIAYRFGVE